MCPCIASIILITTKLIQLFFIHFFLKRSTCFRRFLRPSSGAHNCIHSFKYCQPVLLQAGIVDEMELLEYLKLCIQLCAPDDGRRNRLKHVERFKKKWIKNSWIRLVVIKIITVTGFQTGNSNNVLIIKSPLSWSLQSNHGLQRITKTWNSFSGHSAIYTRRYFVLRNSTSNKKQSAPYLDSHKNWCLLSTCLCIIALNLVSCKQNAKS